MVNQIRFLFIMLIILAICTTPLLASDFQKMTHEDYEIIKEKIVELRLRIKRLEKRKQHPVDRQKVINRINELTDELEEYADILYTVERKSLLDLINLDAELRTQFDWFDFKGHDYVPYSTIKEGPKKHERVRMLPTNRLRLSLRASLTDKFNFTSRLNMIRHWQDDDFPIYPELNFMNTARKPSNLDIKVERAYIDYFFDPTGFLPIALTFGRLPTSDGLPSDLKENTPRKSTFAGLAYDCESDGIALSVLMDQYIPFRQFAFRGGWIRRVDDNTQYFLGQKLSDQFGIYREDEDAMDTLNIILAQFEGYFPAPFSDTLFILSYFWIPDAPPSDLRYNPSLQPFYDTDISMLYIDKPESEGQLTKWTFLIESKNILQSRLDCFLDISYLKTKAEGALKFMFKPSSLGLLGEPVLARHAYARYHEEINPNYIPDLIALQNAPPPIGLLNSDGTTDQSGHAIHVGFRYTLPLAQLNNPKVGIEYNYGSQYWFGINAGSIDKINKLDIRGNVWDFYYIQPLNRNFMTRFRYMRVDFDYDDGMSFYHGEPMPIDHRVSQFSIVLDASF